MSIETTLYAAINNDAAVTTLVADRIYPQVAPDSASVPYVTYQVISTEAHNKLAGAPDTERKVVQVNCVSNSYANAKAIAEAIKSALNVSVGYLISEGDDYFSQTQNHRVRLDFALIG
jgi:hypothetical protein